MDRTGAAVADPRRSGRLPWVPALVLSLAWLGYGAATLRGHGVTMDETSIFYAGDRTLFYLTHPTVPGALDLVGSGEPAGFHSRFARFPDFTDPWHYPVLTGLLMAVSNQVFSGWLHWLDDIDAHHLGLVALHAFGLLCFTLAACRLLGRRAGLCAGLLYALYPTIVGFAFNNPKDLPATDFYGATVLMAGAGLLQKRPRDLWIAGLLCGLSLSCKMNGAFAAVTLLLWLPFAGTRLRDLRANGLLAPILWLPAVAFAVFFVLWPWMWQGTPVDWAKHVFEYFRFYLSFARSDRPGFTAFPLIAVGSVTPPLGLALAALGLALAWARRGERPVGALLTLWLVLPLLRIALPHSEFYDGNRHFLEYIGALCALGGLGASFALEVIAELPFAAVAVPAAAAIGLYVLWLPLREYRPYEGAYFNAFVGGLGGAQRSALFYMRSPPHDSRSSGSEGDFWDSSLRDALEVARGIVPPGDTLGICGPSSPTILADLTSRPPYALTASQNDPDYVYYMPRECYCRNARIRAAESERPVVARVERGGGLIYEILGPRVPYPLPPVTAESRYARLP